MIIQTSQPIELIREIFPDGNFKVTLRGNINDLGRNMLDSEENIQLVTNNVGTAITELALDNYDINEPYICVGNEKYYKKGAFPQTYETSFGSITLTRSVYQSADGGKQYCPLEVDAGLVNNATPKFAKIVSSKSARMGAPAVEADLLESNGRKISKRYVKTIMDSIGRLALEKQTTWTYGESLEVDKKDVASLSLGVDGTCMFLINGGGWREAMVATISLFDANGNRLHTIYLGAEPEHGKERFLALVDKEWNRIREKYPNAVTQGLADGATWIWNWLTERTDYQLLDFFHMYEYVAKAAVAIFKTEEEQENFKAFWCHYIKHYSSGGKKLVEELEKIVQGQSRKIDKAALRIVIEYLKNQADRLNYRREYQAGRPIGSGITEAACKQLIKARMCQAGMRWKLEGAANVIAVRSLLLTYGRWEQFWYKTMRHGGYQKLMARAA
ncbi:MAG: ISKra4 family transposase [Bacteroidales bacterium]|jgi:hypothetical protein|nr:ISKra4 family transposase [Bacteroidales bacterium]